MADVARLAGVSIATVSFVINGTKPVAPSTQLRVQESMRALGYRRNTVARALASRRSRILALLYPSFDHPLGAGDLPFFTGAAAVAHELGHHLVIWPTKYSGEEVLDVIRSGLLDGVLIMEILLNDARIQPLQDGGMPFVLIGRPADPAPYRYVDVDFAGSIELSIHHLRLLGHRQIAIVMGNTIDLDTNYGPTVRVLDAYRNCAERFRFTPVIVTTDLNFSGGVLAAKQVISIAADTTAIIVTNNDAIWGIYHGLSLLGMSIPHDISIISYTTQESFGLTMEPPLTTLLSSAGRLGGLAARALIRSIEDPATPIDSELVPSTLLVRGTTAPAKI